MAPSTTTTQKNSLGTPLNKLIRMLNIHPYSPFHSKMNQHPANAFKDE
jgi:hypothetical protein